MIRRAATVGWLFLAVSVWSQQVVLNEIHFDPDVKTERVEFIELHNASASAVNLSGWQLTEAVEFTIPNGTTLPAGGYLVIGENPAALQAKFTVTALGPWLGNLANEGEKIVLRNAAGGIEDQVQYQLGFPWPTVGAAPGYSIELMNPAFDNNLGGNWRSSFTTNTGSISQTLLPSGSSWRYFKGLTEASSPATSWRAADFNDASWSAGTMPVGFDPGIVMGTYLADMRSNYTTVFFRTKFAAINAAELQALSLQALYDDGFKVWINGQSVLDANIATGEVPCTNTATATRESASYETFNLPPPQNYLVPGTNVIAIQAANVVLNGSTDFFLDVRLLASVGPPSFGPTPGRMNSAFTTVAPPQIRQVDHSPNAPSSGQPVTITAKVTDPDGVAGVTLHHQFVAPGSYIELTDPAYTNNWTTVAMNDAGLNGDALAGDSVFTAVLPAALQQHRRLVRYRITATDGSGRSITVPYADDPQPNFAYFCYDGVPAWQGAVNPGSTPVLNFDTNVMRRLPVIHLIAKNNTVNTATWFSRYSGDVYLWSGTLVYDGQVYDHVHYRARGGVWRYSMVKNMWKFDFNRGHDFQMRDDYGEKYGTKWTKLNLGACIQQGDFGHRGEQGMFESVGFRLFNLAGVESPKTTFTQFRVIDEAGETTANQYEGDFWGLYLAVEQEDGRFLDEHDLPDGNLYKMESGTGELNNLGPPGPADKSDLNAFLGTYTSTTPDTNWWRTNLDLARYYSYRTIVEGIHHYDIGADKNYFYYRNPDSGLWSTHTWDLDLTWANNMYGDGNEPFNSRVLPQAAFRLEYRNRVREIRDLLFNTDQAWQLIDECAALARGPTNGPTFLDADRAMWDYNPKMASTTYTPNLNKAGQGLYYKWPNEPTVTKDFNGCVQLLKNYVVARGVTLDSLAVDIAIPAQPALTYTGPANHPLDQLRFQCSAYAGANPFAALQWRAGEVTDTNAPAYDPAQQRDYEITAKWMSGEIAPFTNALTLPADALKAGHAYRVRVRMKDTTGRWSKWSAPSQFIAGQPEGAAALLSHLRVSEVMFNPPAGNDYEFIELRNLSDSLTLNLAGANFTAGIDHTFTNGTTIPPLGYMVLTKNPDAADFRAHYNLAANVPVVGPYSGSLANDGEQLTLKTSAGGSEIAAFNFGDGRGWPPAADGAGHSLVPLNSSAMGQATGALDYPGNWRASSRRNGSPGQADPEPPAPTLLLNEITAHTDYNDPAHPEYDSDDWIELHNVAGTNVALTGWFLSDDPANLKKWAVPPSIVPARGWITFSEVTNFHNPITTGFGIDKAGEQILLSFLPGTAEDRVVDAIAFKGQENEVSLGRYPDGAPHWYAMPRTRNAINAAPLAGVVTSEIMYHPPDFGTNDNTQDEFIELLNPTAQPVLLHDTNGAWRLDGGIEFDFPSGTTLPAGGTLLVVHFNPTNAATLAAFRLANGITNTSLAILGPYAGKLGNRSDRIALEKPQFPDLPGDPYSWVIVDEVIYGNQSPWPVQPNGGGDSLHRLCASHAGNAPANWTHAAPTAGSTSTDWDLDGLPGDWELAHGLNPADASDAAQDADGDGLTNGEEFLCGTDPQDAASVLRFDSASASGNGITLQFTAQAGRSYAILWRASLSGGVWQSATNIPPAAATQPITISLTETPGTNVRFYRLATPGE